MQQNDLTEIRNGLLEGFSHYTQKSPGSTWTPDAVDRNGLYVFHLTKLNKYYIGTASNLYKSIAVFNSRLKKPVCDIPGLKETSVSDREFQIYVLLIRETAASIELRNAMLEKYLPLGVLINSTPGKKIVAKTEDQSADTRVVVDGYVYTSITTACNAHGSSRQAAERQIENPLDKKWAWYDETLHSKLPVIGKRKGGRKTS